MTSTTPDICRTRGANRPFAELRADLYIAAMSRSGSTLLANLLTAPMTTWVLLEPDIPNGGVGPHVLTQAKRFGYRINDEDWHSEEKQDEAKQDLELFMRLFSDKLAKLQKWGVKEVEPSRHDSSISLLRPKKVVILVRDIPDVVISLADKINRDDNSELFGWDEAWLRRYVLESSSKLLKLLEAVSDRYRFTLRYEDFVSEARVRAEVARWLDWPLHGDPAANLHLYGRGYEVLRHGRKISTASLRRFERARNKRVVAVASEMAEQAVDYRRAFGYQ